MKNRDPNPLEKVFSTETFTSPKKRSEVFHLVIVDDGFAHSTRRDGISFFESIEAAESFANELVESGETLKAFVETIDGYGIPYDPDPEIYSDARRREAVRRLRQADDETYERNLHKWRREDALLQTHQVFELKASAEFKRDFILALLQTLGMSEASQTVCRQITPEEFLTRYAVLIQK